MLKSRFNLATAKTEEAQSEATTAEGEEKGFTEHQGFLEGGEEAVVEEQEKKVVYETKRLGSGEISARLSMLGLTAEGDGYTYLKASCTGMRLTDLTSLKSYKHLQFLDVSDNNLEIEALQAISDLPNLVLLHADKNALYSAGLPRMKFLQVIIMNNNKIQTVQDVYQPELCTLEVGYNRIHRISFINRMPQLKCLDFRYNLIRDISDLDFPNLDSLYLAGNKITTLYGLERLTNLRILHVRYNPIKFLHGFEASLKKLQYVNLRNCKVSSLRQVKRLKVLPALDALVLKGCPYMGGTGEEEAGGQEEDDPELRIEVLASLPRLKKLNKGIYSPEERIEAKDLMAQWLEEGEKEEEEVDEEHHDETSDIAE